MENAFSKATLADQSQGEEEGHRLKVSPGPQGFKAKAYPENIQTKGIAINWAYIYISQGKAERDDDP